MNDAPPPELDTVSPSLAAELAQVDANAAAPIVDPAAPPPPVVDYEGEARDLVEFAYASFEPLYPSLAHVYTEEKRARIVTAAAPLMAKYHWTLDGFLAGWGIELRFAMVVVPLVPATYKAVRADLAAQAAAAAEAERAEPPPPPPAPAQAPVSSPPAPPPPNIRIPDDMRAPDPRTLQ